MARIFITGSADGLGLRSAQALAKRGHEVYLHARSARRAEDARAACPDARDVLVADLSSTEETRRLAGELSRRGPWDAIVHNAGLMRGVAGLRGKEGLPALFAVNTLAPYLLTCLVDPPPRRYVFVSSGMHRGGDASLRDLPGASYSDSKLHDVMLAFWFGKRLAARGGGGGGDTTTTTCNALDPGWVPTKMGGSGAPDDIGKAVDTYVMPAEGSGAAEGVSGKYWYQCRESTPSGAASDEGKQRLLVESLEKISGVKAP
ncbi:NAD(P)-binding protein [Xylariomycetidae sp. FL2044]|nr:NAD(P)-binding protein [Xylariomycetidae sp. FL2044]